MALFSSSLKLSSAISCVANVFESKLSFTERMKVSSLADAGGAGRVDARFNPMPCATGFCLDANNLLFVAQKYAQRIRALLRASATRSWRRRLPGVGAKVNPFSSTANSAVASGRYLILYCYI